MRVLLDTHVLLWWLADDNRLGPRVRAVLQDGHNDVFVSAVTFAEIAIKKSLGKLDAPPGLLGALAEEGFEELPLLSTHSVALEALPRHHKDPFDRLLLAQATTEKLAFASYDAEVRDYDVEVITD